MNLARSAGRRKHAALAPDLLEHLRREQTSLFRLTILGVDSQLDAGALFKKPLLIYGRCSAKNEGTLLLTEQRLPQDTQRTERCSPFLGHRF